MYLIIDQKTNVVVGANFVDRPLEGQYTVLVENFSEDMLGSIFFAEDNYIPHPKDDQGRLKEFLVSDSGRWVDPRHKDERWDALRTRRNQCLAEADWTQLNDAPMQYDYQAEWAEWRQSLRNIPQRYNNIDDAEAALEALINNKP